MISFNSQDIISGGWTFITATDGWWWGSRNEIRRLKVYSDYDGGEAQDIISGDWSFTVTVMVVRLKTLYQEVGVLQWLWWWWGSRHYIRRLEFYSDCDDGDEAQDIISGGWSFTVTVMMVMRLKTLYQEVGVLQWLWWWWWGFRLPDMLDMLDFCSGW